MAQERPIMARGERNPKPKVEESLEDGVAIWPVITRLAILLAGLDGPGVRLRIGAALALTLAAKVGSVLSPLLLGLAINHLAAGGGQAAAPAFFLFAVLWSGLRFAAAAGPEIRNAVFAPVSEEAQRQVGRAVFAHVHALSVRFHQAKRTGSLHRTIERGVRAIDFLLRFLAFNIAPTVIELALAAGVLAWRFGPSFALIAVATVLVYGWITFGVTEWRLKYRREMNARDSEAAGRAVDSLLNFETVKAFAAEARETARFDHSLAAYARAAVRSNSSLVLLNIAQALVMNIGLAALVALAGWRVLGGDLGPGDIAAIILIMLNLYAPLNVLGFAFREIKQSAIDMEKMFSLLAQSPDVADKPGAPDLKAPLGEVRFDSVSFVHEGRDQGLDGVSFTIAPGTTTALVGPSGAGKSTLLKLLFRFYDPSAGAVRIDGQDVRDVTQTSLRAQLGLVPQDVVLFNDTLRYNIAYGHPQASQQELEAAAAKAQLLDFIQGLPDGWETRVGERGLKLSGGEKQRVGIARVVLKDPKILILDEATSSLDSRTEAEVQSALDIAARGRTTLVVAHRLSTIARADQILVLKDGRLVERGRHGDLVALGGVYAELWRKQALEPAA